MPRSRAETWISRPGPHLDQNVLAGYAAVAVLSKEHKRPQDWRAGPFRARHRLVASPNSGACSEAMSAIRVSRTREGKHRSATRCHAPDCGDLTIQVPGPHLDKNVLLGSYAAVASASILVSSGGLFSVRRTALSAAHHLKYLAQTWHSKIGIRDECRK